MRIGSLFGIPVYLHWTFATLWGGLLVWAAWNGGWIGLTLAGIVSGFAVLSVILHEFGHALAAREYGIHTQSVTMYPMGGVAAIEDMPTDPWAEIVISVAGPLVNVALFFLFGAASWAMGSEIPWMLAMMNIGMGLFNLLPAYPMDGGRVLRAAMALKFGHRRATRYAIRMGTFFAWSFLIIGATALHPTLFLVGGFLLVVLHSEKAHLRDQMMNDLRDGKGWKPEDTEFHALSIS